MMRTILVAVVVGCMGASAFAEDLDYYRNLRYPSKLVPGVGLDQVEQEGGPKTVGYQRRTVQWWPRQGQDFVEIPAGAPLRTWTRNKGQYDPQDLAGVTRHWTASDPETFKAHLIAFRGFGTSSAGALYANWQFNQPKAVRLEDSYVNNNGILHGRPKFGEDNDGGQQYVVFSGRDQYAEAPPSVADFGELTLDILVKRSKGKGGRLFDFGTGDEECFYLSIDGSGKPTLTARHQGTTYTLAASTAIPASTWGRVRLEMNGATALIHIDGKQVANGKFTFHPRDVFIGDRPEGNFIACARNKSEFFHGQLDHFRIYRKVHNDFTAVGAPPPALTQMQEWSEQDQQQHDDWQKRRKAQEVELRAGKYGQMQKEIHQLGRDKSIDADQRSARMDKLRSAAAVVRENALKSAGLSGPNPYLGKQAADLYHFQRSLKYHTTADWDYRTKTERAGELPAKTKKWLQSVRGY